MKKTLYITATLPALTVTFIYREILRLRTMGMKVDTVSMNTPSSNQVSTAAREFLDTTCYLDQQSIFAKFLAFGVLVLTRPLRTGRCLWHFLTASPTKFPKDYFRLIYHLVEACYLARKFADDPPDHVHSHFINGPTSIAMFLAMLLDVPFSFTMHASMIWRDPIAFRNKLETCDFCVSISEYNKRYVIETYGEQFGNKIHIVHCGLDTDKDLVTKTGRERDGAVRLLGVGQLNRRKGFHFLIPALAKVRDQGVPFQCTIIGDGDEMPVLKSLVDEHGLQDEVKLAGAVLHEQVQEALGGADIFVLPCVISEDGWRDGIPVALMEAMYNRIPVISTNILGLPELIDHDENGLLVPPEDPESLAAAIVRLCGSAETREVLGKSGREKVIADFNNEKSAGQLRELILSSHATG